VSVESKLGIQQNASGLFEVQLAEGDTVTCQSRDDAELVLDAARRFYEGNSGRKLPRRTLAVLERAGLHAANSVLYRSVMGNLAEE
jgi:hypothetical protein